MGEGSSAELPPRRPPRLAYAILQGVTGAALILAAFITAKFETIFEQLEMRELPAPTEAFLALCRFLRWPLGMGVLALAVMALVVLSLRGALDQRLRKLIGLNILAWVLGIPFWVLAIYMPIFQIQQHLNK